MSTLYRYYDNGGDLLYVGITDRGIARGFGHASVALWWHEVAYAEFDDVPKDLAFLAERLAIWTERPLYNRAGRVSTATRQALRSRVLALNVGDLQIGPEEAAPLVGLHVKEFEWAVHWGFIHSDHPRAMWTYPADLLAFIGESDPGPATPGTGGYLTRKTLSARMRGIDMYRESIEPFLPRSA